MAKANDHSDLLQALAEEGLGFECVSMEEVHHVLSAVPAIGPDDILFTPNFAPRDEYQAAFESGVRLTVDNSWAIQQWPEIFAGVEHILESDKPFIMQQAYCREKNHEYSKNKP